MKIFHKKFTFFTILFLIAAITFLPVTSMASDTLYKFSDIDLKISVPEEPKRTQTIPKYNYTKLLSDFYASGEPQRFVHYLYGNENEHRVPRAAYCNKKARELSFKDIRAYHVGNGIMLMRTNLKEKGE